MVEISYCPSMQLKIIRAFLKTSDCLLYLSAYVKVFSNTLLDKLFFNCPLERAKTGWIYIIIFCWCKCHCNMSFHLFLFFSVWNKNFVFIFKLNIRLCFCLWGRRSTLHSAGSLHWLVATLGKMESWAAGHTQESMLSDSAVFYNSAEQWWGMTQKILRVSGLGSQTWRNKCKTEMLPTIVHLG